MAFTYVSDGVFDITAGSGGLPFRKVKVNKIVVDTGTTLIANDDNGTEVLNLGVGTYDLNGQVFTGLTLTGANTATGYLYVY